MKSKSKGLADTSLFYGLLADPYVVVLTITFILACSYNVYPFAAGDARL